MSKKQTQIRKAAATSPWRNRVVGPRPRGPGPALGSVTLERLQAMGLKPQRVA